MTESVYYYSLLDAFQMCLSAVILCVIVVVLPHNTDTAGDDHSQNTFFFRSFFILFQRPTILSLNITVKEEIIAVST